MRIVETWEMGGGVGRGAGRIAWYQTAICNQHQKKNGKACKESPELALQVFCSSFPRDNFSERADYALGWGRRQGSLFPFLQTDVSRQAQANGAFQLKRKWATKDTTSRYPWESLSICRSAMVS